MTPNHPGAAIARMSRAGPRALLIAGSVLALPGVAGTSWAHHPGGNESSGPWFLSLLILVIAFALVWGISAFLEHRAKSPSDEVDPRGEE
jgi:hypothetical protein